MTKLETLVVPVELGKWLQSRSIGHSGAYFTTINAMFHYWETVAGSPTGDFIYRNKKELIEVIIGSRGYKVEEPLYYALVKGHELIGNTKKYWAHNKYDSEDIFIGYETRDDSPIIVKNTKSRWNELGVNDSNADFVKVDD